MQKGIITLPVRGSHIQSIVDAQRTIDKIFITENKCVDSVLRNDENILEQINHINLDVVEEIESLEVCTARILPKKERVTFGVSDVVQQVKKSEIVQEGKEFTQGLFRFVTLSAKIVLNVLLILDKGCERILTGMQSIPENEKKNIPRNEIAKDVHYIEDTNGVIHSYKNNTGGTFLSPRPAVKEVAPFTEYVPQNSQTYSKEDAQYSNNFILQSDQIKNATYTKSSTFVQVIAILYTEIVYGGRLKDIDSI